MLVAFKREVVIPLSAVVLCAAALSASPRMVPAVTALLGVVVAASTASALVRWLRSSRRRSVEVLPAMDEKPSRTGISLTAGARARTLEPAIRPRTQETDDAADLVRMDDDGG